MKKGDLLKLSVGWSVSALGELGPLCLTRLSVFHCGNPSLSNCCMEEGPLPNRDTPHGCPLPTASTFEGLTLTASRTLSISEMIRG